MRAMMGRPMGIVVRNVDGSYSHNRARLAAARARMENGALCRPTNISPPQWDRFLRLREQSAAMAALTGIDPAALRMSDRMTLGGSLALAKARRAMSLQPRRRRGL